MTQSDLIGWLLIIIMITCATATLIALRKISQYLDNEALADQNQDNIIDGLAELNFWLNEKTIRYKTLVRKLKHELDAPETSIINPEPEEPSEPPHELIIMINQYEQTEKELTTVHDTIKKLLDNQQ